MGYKAKHTGKYSSKNGKFAVLAVALLLIVCCTVGGTLAFMYMTTDSVVNTFLPTDVSISVEEDLKSEPGVKKDVVIKNTGDVAAYIRAVVIVTWQDVEGDIYGEMPVENQDYTITWTKDGWVKGADGYYYYQAAVDGKNEKDEPGTTGILFTECEPVSGKAPAGYDLHVEILAQAIQSQPAEAVDSWDNAKVDLTGNADGTALTVTNRTSQS